MHELGKKWEDALFLATLLVNLQIIEYLGCFSVKIITRI